ncbi:hypothetical protein FRC07_010319 [Ceratobasidium sp. 392]|nr:hypothetical protein FRC07_010319 [Ceratobasidium sp. 392]
MNILQQVQQELTALSQFLQQAMPKSLTNLHAAGHTVLKDTLAEAKKPAGQKRKNDEEGGGGKQQKNKQVVIATVKFGAQRFLKELASCIHEQELEVEEFFRHMMMTNQGTHKENLSRGLSLIMHGMHIESDQQVAHQLKLHADLTVTG